MRLSKVHAVSTAISAIVDHLFAGDKWGSSNGRGIFLGICFVISQAINANLPIEELFGNNIIISNLFGFGYEQLLLDYVGKAVLFVAEFVGVGLIPKK